MEKVEEIDKKIPHKNKIARFIQIAQTNFERARINQGAAEMAYYLLLSLLPILLVIANIIPLLPIEASDVMSLLQGAMPYEVFNMIEPIIEGYLESASGGAISFGLITAIWSASQVFQTLRRVLDDVYGSVQKKNFFIARALSMLMMIAILAVIGVAIFFFVFGEHILNFLNRQIGFNIPYIEEFLALRWVVLVIILFAVFFIVYQYVPNHHLSLKYSYPGAVFTTIGWLILTQAFSIYIALSGDDIANAAFGSFIALMFFLFLSSIVVLVGAMINAMKFEWQNGQSVEAYEAERLQMKELEKSDWTGYPDENRTIVLKRKLFKVNTQKSEETHAEADASLDEQDSVIEEEENGIVDPK